MLPQDAHIRIKYVKVYDDTAKIIGDEFFNQDENCIWSIGEIPLSVDDLTIYLPIINDDGVLAEQPRDKITTSSRDDDSNMVMLEENEVIIGIVAKLSPFG